MAGAIVVRRLHDDGYAGRGRVREQLGERVRAERARADRLVPVAGRPAAVLRVVGVHQPQPVRAHGVDQGVQRGGGTARARQVVPGSLRVIAAVGDDRNALVMYEVDTEGGSIGSKTFPSAQTWLLDESGKIQVERIISYAVPRPS